jgi:hypothetical protein
MSLILPDLDDRNWRDLVNQAVAQVPRWEPLWTDHNAHDPGITLIELLAWLTEQEIYRLNRITAADYRSYLRLFQTDPQGAAPAHCILEFRRNVASGVTAQTVRIPRGAIVWPLQPLPNDDGGLQHRDPNQFVAHRRTKPVRQHQLLPFRTLHSCDANDYALNRVKSFDGLQFVDLTSAYNKQLPIFPWGTDPRPANVNDSEKCPALYLHFSKRIQRSRPCQLWFEISGFDANEFPRAMEQQSDIATLRHRTDDSKDSVRTVWEAFTGDDSDAPQWTAVRALDETHGLSRSGRVWLWGLGKSQPFPFGNSSTPYLNLTVRCRVLGGLPDAAPQLNRIAVNVAEAIQSVPIATLVNPPRSPWVTLGQLQWKPWFSDADIQNHLKEFDVLFPHSHYQSLPWRRARLPLKRSRRVKVNLYSSTLQKFEVAHDLVEVAVVGLGNGLPGQSFSLRKALADAYQIEEPTDDASFPEPESLRIWTLEPVQQFVAVAYSSQRTKWKWLDGEKAQTWCRCEDLIGSTRTDRHFTYDSATSSINFGDGELGRVVPQGAVVVVAANVTSGTRGMVAAQTEWTFAPAKPDEPQNSNQPVTITTALPAHGCRSAEAITATTARETRRIWAHEELLQNLDRAQAGSLDDLPIDVVRKLAVPEQAITAVDFERLALATPGRRICRARAWVGMDPRIPDQFVDGVVTVTVISALPERRPTATPTLLRAVRRHLNRHRPVGTRVVVAGPDYVIVDVEAKVRAAFGSDAARLQADLDNALNQFFHSLKGGSNGQGWRFGRDVYRNDVVNVIAGVSRVTAVTECRLRSNSGDDLSSEANIRLKPHQLVALGNHKIEVVIA